MKKVFYESWIAKHLLFKGYTTITLLAWVLTAWTKEEAKQSVINHECVHARQWIELTVAAGALLWLGMLVFGFSPWCLLIATAVFYVWYIIEAFIRWIIGFGKKDYSAYHNISFEREAKLAEYDNNYLENCVYFDWLQFYKEK